MSENRVIKLNIQAANVPLLEEEIEAELGARSPVGKYHGMEGGSELAAVMYADVTNEEILRVQAIALAHDPTASTAGQIAEREQAAKLEAARAKPLPVVDAGAIIDPQMKALAELVERLQLELFELLRAKGAG